MTNSEFKIYAELYTRGVYNKIPIGQYPDGDYFYMTKKQEKALRLLNDGKTSNIGYGGSARSGKSILECTAIIFDNFIYPGIAWGLGRKELTTLKKTVLITLFNQFNFYGFKATKLSFNNNFEYKHNDQSNIVRMPNGSDIFLIDTKFQPSDPLNTRFGGFELTKCAVDESNETAESVINKLYERTGWRLNDKYKIKRKLFECFNPDKNHVYSRFYIPFRDKIEPEYKKFIPALPGDNPNPAVKEWVEDIIETGDLATIERQINGNFDYDNDPTKLCDYDAICDMFTNDHIQGGKKYISADLAMQGRDKFIAGRWDGLICTIAIDKAKSEPQEIEDDLNELKIINDVPNSQIVADSDGLGQYLRGYIKNIKTFHGGSTKFKKEDPLLEIYGNLKDACAFKLAEVINNRLIKINCTAEQEVRIKKEISVCLKRDNVDLDVKKIIKKDKMKKLMGGDSPDHLDQLLMRMFFEITNTDIHFKDVGRYDVLPKGAKKLPYGINLALNNNDIIECYIKKESIYLNVINIKNIKKNLYIIASGGDKAIQDLQIKGYNVIQSSKYNDVDIINIAKIYNIYVKDSAVSLLSNFNKLYTNMKIDKSNPIIAFLNIISSKNTLW